MWSRRLLYLLALTAALMGQLFDVGYLFHFLFFAAACLPLLGLAGAVLLAAEIYGILGKIEGGDSLCLN